MIVVEGPDGSGKTTLIKELSARLDLPVAPRVVSKEAEAMVDLVEWTEENVARGFQRTIFDRHRLISEPIYGPTLRNEPQPNFDDVEWMTRMLRSFYDSDPVIIFCLPPLEVVWDNVMEDPDNEVVSRDIWAIWGAYLNRYVAEKARGHDVILYDYSDVTAPLVRSYILRVIGTRILREEEN